MDFAQKSRIVSVISGVETVKIDAAGHRVDPMIDEQMEDEGGEEKLEKKLHYSIF